MTFAVELMNLWKEALQVIVKWLCYTRTLDVCNSVGCSKKN
jgi:hypothetical protein